MNFKRKKVNILGVEHDISYVNWEKVEKEKCWGSYEAYNKKIELFDSKDDFEKFHLLMHEVIHAIGERFGLDFHVNTDMVSCDDVSQPPATITQSKNHLELHLLAYGITDFLFRNKLLKD